MKSTLLLIQGRLNACKKEVIELEKANNQLREALDSVPLAPRYRQQIEIAYLRCSQKISKLKSRVLNTEILSKNTEVEKNASDSYI